MNEDKILEQTAATGENAVLTAEAKAKARKKDILWWVGYSIAVLAIYLLLGVFFCVGVVFGSSMEPTIHSNSFFIGQRWKAAETITYGDVVHIDRDKGQHNLVKRVIGMAGDTITFEGGKVYRNGELLDEPYLADDVMTYGIDAAGGVTVEDGYVFVMGDNRENSLDSRYDEVGQVPLSRIRCFMLAYTS